MGFELNPFEIGKTWSFPTDVLVQTPRAKLLIYQGYTHNADSVVVNIREPKFGGHKHIIPGVHDFGYDHQCDCYGNFLVQSEWDWTYYWLSKHSNDALRRLLAPVRYWGVRKLGTPFWKATPNPLPIPPEHIHKYGYSDQAWAAQMMAEQLIVNEKGRLELIPPMINRTMWTNHRP